MGFSNTCEKCTVTSNKLGKYKGVITYNNVDRRKYHAVVIGLCSNSALSFIDLSSLK